MNIYNIIRNICGRIENRLIAKLFFRRKKSETYLDKVIKERLYSKLERSRLFELFHIVPISFSSHPLIAFLMEDEKFRFDDPRNTLMLPLGRELANKMGTAVYTKNPCQSYVVGLTSVLDKFWAAADGVAAGNGDPSAAERIAQQTFYLVLTMRNALINRDLLPDDQQFRDAK
jgi:hypothetical protein